MRSRQNRRETLIQRLRLVDDGMFDVIWCLDGLRESTRDPDTLEQKQRVLRALPGENQRGYSVYQLINAVYDVNSDGRYTRRVRGDARCRY